MMMMMWLTAGCAVVNLGLAPWLIPRAGITGATAVNPATQFPRPPRGI